MPAATSSTASSVPHGPFQRGLPGQALPVQRVVERVQHDVVGEVLAGDLLDRRHDVILRDHDDRRLGVERDRAEVGPVDRQPDEARVRVAAPQHAVHLRGGHRDEGQRYAGQPLVPDPHPFRGGHPRNVGEPERGGCFGAGHHVRLPGVPGGRTGDGRREPARSIPLTHEFAPDRPDDEARHRGQEAGCVPRGHPAEFQEGVVSRAELNALQTDPPEWLQELRRNGPHPRPVVAAKLGVSIAGLARGGVSEALTTEQIEALKTEDPGWLRRERATQAEVRKEAARIKEKNAEQAAKRS